MRDVWTKLISLSSAGQSPRKLHIATSSTGWRSSFQVGRNWMEPERSTEDRQILRDVRIPETVESKERIHEQDGPQQQEHHQSEIIKS